jgi:hypothetical protein
MRKKQWEPNLAVVDLVGRIFAAFFVSGGFLVYVSLFPDERVRVIRENFIGKAGLVVPDSSLYDKELCC